MRDETRIRQRLAGICLAGLVLFNYPLLLAVSAGSSASALFVYLFVVWILLIAAMAFVAERKSGRERPDLDKS